MERDEEIQFLKQSILQKELQNTELKLKLDQLKLLCRTSDISQKLNEEINLLALKLFSDLQWVFYPNTLLTVFSNEYSTLTGHSTLVYDGFDEINHLVHPADLQRFKSNISDVASGRKNSYCYNLRWLCADKKYKWIKNQCLSIKNENGEVIKIIGLCNDITKTHENRDYMLLESRALKYKAKEFQIIFDNIDIGIVKGLIHPEPTIQNMNTKFLNILGYTKEQCYTNFNNKISGFVFPDDLHILEKNIKTLLNTGNAVSFELRAKCHDTSVIWLAIRIVMIKDETGKIVGVYTFQDITGEKSTQDELKINEEILRVAMEQSDTAIFKYDPLSDTVYNTDKIVKTFRFNPVIKNFTQYYLDRKIVPSEDIETFLSIYHAMQDGQNYAQGEYRIITREKGPTWYDVKMTNIFDSNGKPVLSIGTFKDINELKMLETEKQYRAAITSNSLYTYEVNVTQDKFIKGAEIWKTQYNTDTDCFSEISSIIEKNAIHHDDKNKYREFISCENLIMSFNNNENKKAIEYRRLDENGDYIWVLNTMSLIKDVSTGNIKGLSFITNINDKKEKELKTTEEQKFYEAMFSSSTTMYEANLTKNIFIRGNEDWEERFGVKYSNIYSEVINSFADNIINKDDVKYFYTNFLRENVISAYNEGKKQLYCEYRCPNGAGEMTWVSCTMHIIKDMENNIKGFSCIEDINDKKLKELDLLYKAERDYISGMYNKGMAENTINEYLQSDSGKSSIHAFIMLDIDNFKSINDNFGHLFGDVVLSEVSGKIRELFRDDDITCRIGGDEFAILMKNIPSKKAALSKATELCRHINETYTKNSEEFNISASIGIALYSQHGKTYSELYRNSDTALYFSKETGKNKFTLYNASMISKSNSIKKIENSIYIENKLFSENVSEYIFRILYEAEEKEIAINSVLEFIGKHYNFSRVYIFENSILENNTTNTFEWFNKGISARIPYFKNIPNMLNDDYAKNFNKSGVFNVPDIKKASSEVRRALYSEGVQSILQFAIKQHNKFKGFVGFEECKQIRNFTTKEISELENITHILGVFLLEMRSQALSFYSDNLTNSILNSLDCYAYVVDLETYRIIYMNEKVVKKVPYSNIGDICYNTFYDTNIPCSICHMKELAENKIDNFTTETYSNLINAWVKLSGTPITWSNGKKACLMTAVDISKYK